MALARMDIIANLIYPSPPGPTSSRHDGVSSAVDVVNLHKLELPISHFVAMGIDCIDGFVKRFSCILS